MEVPSRAALLTQIHRLDGVPALAARLPPGAKVHLVGGAVRDLLLHRVPRELDLVVDGDVAKLASAIGGECQLHERFGTATIRLEGHTVDIGAARRERYPRPGALPEVEPASITEDLARRDFTVNAIAVALTGPDPGSTLMVPRALEDLSGGLLRVLHERSFIDDPTRLLRLVRYATRLGFRAEARTAELAELAREDDALAAVSGPRIATELRLLAREADPVAAFAALRTAGLDGAVAAGFGIGDGGLARRARAVLGAAGATDRLMLGLALRGVAEAERTSLGARLGLTSEETKVIRSLAGVEELAERLSAAGRPSEIAAAATDVPAEVIATAGALGPEATARRWLETLRHVRLEITGDDLLAAGVAAGPALGAGLRAAGAARLDGRAPGRAEQLAEALRAARGAR